MSDVTDMLFPFKLKMLQSTIASKIWNFYYVFAGAISDAFLFTLNY
jgi:hypothetical protein